VSGKGPGTGTKGRKTHETQSNNENSNQTLKEQNRKDNVRGSDGRNGWGWKNLLVWHQLQS
jgi:hypothetical protein